MAGRSSETCRQRPEKLAYTLHHSKKDGGGTYHILFLLVEQLPHTRVGVHTYCQGQVLAQLCHLLTDALVLLLDLGGWS